MNTSEYIEAHIRYDCETGNLYWTRPLNGRQIGKPVGKATGNGYVRFLFFGQRFLVHRVVWFLMVGRWPEYEIDHIDGDKTNNRFSNLRHVTHSQNMAYAAAAGAWNKCRD